MKFDRTKTKISIWLTDGYVTNLLIITDANHLQLEINRLYYYMVLENTTVIY